eukprot:CAMPEP_0115766084 /NCGR_PEP_ID=MMETSP0272-20121206/102945_1 /TAXON_ID=71861 /ORGANISM="Scrippsiella trochoidea, Strain CCMP3099" /LENGTH=668 /DNA_ID=CAMNT_0003211995 /DNA_START=45 /DNA_END=2050 /DNA_ORIENTATION=-
MPKPSTSRQEPLPARAAIAPNRDERQSPTAESGLSCSDDEADDDGVDLATSFLQIVPASAPQKVNGEGKNEERQKSKEAWYASTSSESPSAAKVVPVTLATNAKAGSTWPTMDCPTELKSTSKGEAEIEDIDGATMSSSSSSSSMEESTMPEVLDPWRLPWREHMSYRLSALVTSNPFDYLVCSCIITNAILIGAQCQYNISVVDQGQSLKTPPLFEVAETIFCVVFTAELALRMMCYRLRFFVMADWKWNIFDTVIVTLQLVDVIMEQALGDEKGNAMPSNMNFMRILRILRLVRIVRLVRVLRYFQELRTMVSSIASSCKSLLWTVILVMLLIYVVGVYLTNLIADEAQSDPDVLLREDIQRHYGSLFSTFLSLFQAMTGGVDWDDLMRPLVEEISPMLAVVFSFYITFSVLCMMNVITGVFCESALGSARADKDKEVKRQVEAAFCATDSDGSGRITWKEFTDALTDPKVSECLKAIEIDSTEAKGLFALLDTDGSGDVDGEEFVAGCLRLRGQAKAIDLATLMYFNKRVSTWWVQRMDELEVAINSVQESVEKCRMPSKDKENSKEGTRRDPTGRRASITRLEASEKSLNFGATWSDLKAEGDRKVAEIRKVALAKLQEQQEMEQEAEPLQQHGGGLGRQPSHQGRTTCFGGVLGEGPGRLGKV